MFVHLLYMMGEHFTLEQFLEKREFIAINRSLVMQKLAIESMICSRSGDGTERYSGEITKKLWRSLNNKVTLANFLLSCREGHPSDDNIILRLCYLCKVSSPGATKYKASCSVLDHFNSVNIAEMIWVPNCGSIF